MFKYCLILLISLICNWAYAAVDIFDQNRGVKVDNSQGGAIKRVSPGTRKPTIIDLTFVGISNTNGTALYFKDKKNKQLRVAFSSDKVTNLPGYPGLEIAKIENRIVYLKDEALKYCKDNVKKGIFCHQENASIEMHMVRKYVAQPRAIANDFLSNAKNKRAQKSRQAKTDSTPFR